MPKKTRRKPKTDVPQTQITGWDPTSGRSLQMEQVLRPLPIARLHDAGCRRIGSDYPCGTCLFFVGRKEREGVTRGRCHLSPNKVDKEATDWCGQRRPKPEGERLVE